MKICDYVILYTFIIIILLYNYLNIQLYLIIYIQLVLTIYIIIYIYTHISRWTHHLCVPKKTSQACFTEKSWPKHLQLKHTYNILTNILVSDVSNYYLLVGVLEHEFYFPIYIYVYFFIFSDGLKPPVNHRSHFEWHPGVISQSSRTFACSSRITWRWPRIPHLGPAVGNESDMAVPENGVWPKYICI